jgi:conjugative transfer signal peptidase TraF
MMKLLIVLAAGFALIVGIARIERIRIITTNSAAPAGIYQIVPKPLTRGSLVLACLPPVSAQLAMARGYLSDGDCPAGAEPVAKKVGALPGDALNIESGAVAVNGVWIPHSSTVARDSMNRPLEHAAWGKRMVMPGEVWLFGFNNPHSWDARFFGSVPISNVMGGLKPLITW